MKRRTFCSAAAAVAALTPFTTARSQSWPSGPVRIVVPGGAGSGTDVIARLLAGFLTPELGKQVIVENKAGASGIIAHEHVAQAAPDGNTFIFSATASLMIVPTLTPSAMFRFSDFVPVASVLRTPYLVLVREAAGVPATFAELAANLKKNSLNYSATGNGTMTHLTAALMLRTMGATAVQVPYRGSGDSLTALMSGQVDFTCESTTTALNFVRQKKVRALATTGRERLASLPDVPTLTELGLTEVDVDVVAGLFARKGTPEPILKRMAAEISKGLARPNVIKQFETLDTPIFQISSSDFSQLLAREAARWDKRLKDLNIKIT